MFFDDWEGVYRTIIIAICTYPVLIFILRLAGKRVLSKMNMFDFIITIALGSTVATILLNADITYIEGLAGLGVLIALQYFVTWLSVRSNVVNHLIKAEPVLLYYEGQYITKSMKKERINQDEIKQAIRTKGNASFEKIQAIVLETDGTLSVINKGEETETALDNVQKKEAKNT